MTLWDKIRGYLQIGANRKKVILGGVVVLAVVGLVVFASNLDTLFRQSASRAGISDDLTKTWKDINNGEVDRAHAKSIVVEQGSKHWLYVIGGLDLFTDNAGKQRNQLIKSVQRIEVSAIDGSPIQGAVWQTLRSMNSGHAEFSILNPTVNGKPYLYVVAGDIHVPTIPIGSELTDVPLIYSTIERLDLSTDDASWDIVAKLTGVNFYPEATMFNGRLNIVGGIYGNPFGDLENCGPGTYGAGTTTGPNNGTVTDPINLTEDAGLWNRVKTLPTIGPTEPILSVATTGHTAHTTSVLDPVSGTSPEAGTTTGATITGSSGSITYNLKNFLAAATHRLTATVPKAKAQAGTGMQVTSPEAGVVLQGGIHYPIIVENIPANGNPLYNYIGLYYSTNGAAAYDSSDWKFIASRAVGPLGISRFSYDWTVPADVKSNNVFVRAVVLNTEVTQPGLPYVALSGKFSIGTSLAHELSLAVLSGKFVTTVGEHYVIDLANPSVGAKISELGNDTLNDTTPNDFDGTFPATPIWREGEVMRLGHLRFTTVATSDGFVAGADIPQQIVPVPQGRYGHKLFQDGNQLVVVGGASWMPKISLHWKLNELSYAQTTRYFWVIEDTHFPTFTKSGSNDQRFLPTDGGGYIGHVAYTLASNTSFWNPSAKYSFNAGTGGGTKGRAFFGLAKSGEEWTVVGGLENAANQYQIIDLPSSQLSYTGGIVTQVTNRTNGLGTTSWAERDPYVNGEKVYNLATFGLNDRMIAYGGQTQFCNVTAGSTFVGDPHVPDPAQPVSNTTALYQRSNDIAINSWHQMADIGSPSQGQDDINHGLKGEYFVDTDSNHWASTPITKTDSMIQFDWGSNGPSILGVSDHFSVSWTGEVRTPVNKSGTYQFRVEHDDGFDLTVNNKTISYYGDGLRTDALSIGLEANTRYYIRLRYFETSGDASVNLKWIMPDSTDVQLISSSYLYLPDSGLDTGVPQGTANLVFSADALALVGLTNTTPSINNFYIYRYGGFKQDEATAAGIPIIDKLQGLGVFTDAQAGVPYAPNSSLAVTPTTVAADGYTAGLATITLKDYFNQPVAGYHVRLHAVDNAGGAATGLTITPSAGDSPDGGFDGAIFLKTRSDGTAVFKTVSTRAFVAKITGAWTTNPNAEAGSTNSVNVTFTDLNVPDQRISTIETNKAQAIADGQDVATITVTLKGKNASGVPNSPLPNFYVKIVSNRNVGDNAIDSITILNTKTDNNGQAKFTLKSNTKGLSTISAFYADSAAKLVTDPVKLNRTLSVRFVGKIISLVPDFEKQGQTIPELIATGEQTSWKNTDPKTTVSFARPAHLDLDSPVGMVLDASPLTRTTMAVIANNKPAGTAVRLEILNSGNNWGSFIPRLQADQDRRQIDLTTDANGRASFTYEHGSQTGIVNLKATAGGESRTFKLALANLSTPYEVELTASPSLLDASHTSTTIGAVLYRYTATGKTIIKDSGITVNFTVDDNGTLSPASSNINVVTGRAETTYTRGIQTGSRRIFATISYDGYLLSGIPVTVGDSVSGAGISFDSNNLSIDPATQKITIFNVALAADAELGYWTFTAVTDLGNGEVETDTHPFQVLSANASTVPNIMTVSPNFANAPSSDYKVTLTGQFTNFYQGSSVVTFAHTTDPNAQGISFAATDVVVKDRYTLEATIDVDETATIGYWDVKVDTSFGSKGHEVAEKAGNTDFLVTTASGYQFVITAAPKLIPRDGHSVSTLTTKVGKIDNTSGTVTPLPNVKVDFSLEGGTGGKLQFVTGTTDINGIITNTYTTDAGTESAEIFVRISATINNTALVARAGIVRVVAEGDFIKLVASPTSLPLAGTPDASALTATAIGKDGRPLADGTIINFLILDGNGTVNPAGDPSAGGIATSTYRRPSNLLLPTSVTIIAKSTIPNVGTVFSNPVIVNVGADNSDYSLSFTADKTSVAVGGVDKAKLAAVLTYKGILQRNYPISFQLINGKNGDYLTTVTGRTNNQGRLETEFFAGIYAGNVMVTATPIALFSKSIAITKTADQTVDPRTSTISIVPAFLPADGTSTGLVTVTLRNSQFTPLGGKSVTLASDRTADSLSPAGAQLTDINGQVFFTVKSSSIGTSNLRATVGTLTIGPAQVVFEDPANLIAVSFDIKVPLEAKAYDRNIMLYLREKTTGLIPTIQQAYLTNPATDKITGLPETIYLHAGKTYGLWAKGRYHLARVRTFTAPATSGSTVTLDFANSADNKGLYIADLSSGGTSEVFAGFNDNKINTVDVAVMSNAWGKNSYLADFDGDSKVTTLDIAYWAANWFHNPGDPLP